MKARRSPAASNAAMVKALTAKPKRGAKPGATTADLAHLTGKHASAVQGMLHKLHREGRLVVIRQPWLSLNGTMHVHTFYRLKGR